MADIEEVIEGLERCSHHDGTACLSCPYNKAECVDDLCADALELLKKHIWIPVSERLPESKPEDLEYPTVLIALADGTVELGCYYESTKEWGSGENFDRLRHPVAWVPLPEMQKEYNNNA